jgi:ferrous iron transport protein A
MAGKKRQKHNLSALVKKRPLPPSNINRGGKEMLPLSSLKVGEVGVVQDITGGFGFISRISATGFTHNAKVTMLQNWKRGPVIVFIRDTQMALGRGEAGKIMVKRKAI